MDMNEMEDEERKLNGKPAETPEGVKPGGRAALLEAYRNLNPDLTEEPDDSSLFDFAHNRYAELEGKHGKLTEANQRFAEMVSKDPRLAAVMAELAGEEPKSLPYAVASIYGKEPFEGEDLEEYERGHQEYLKRHAESEQERQKAVENLKQYEATLKKYGADNGLADDQLAAVHDGVMQLADGILTGMIDVPLIDMVYKGLHYEQDVQEAADTGFNEGRNDRIDARLKSPTVAAPDLRDGSGAGKRPAKKRENLSTVNEFDGLKRVPGTAPASRSLY
jgi:hypothetical protein